MNRYDAARLLGLSGQLMPETVRAAWRAAAKKYHPDTNPAGLDMMKAINAVYEVLKDDPGIIDFESEGPSDYPEKLNAALNAIVGLPGLDIEICGAWVWVSGDTRTHKEALKEAGFRWANKKKRWYFRPEEYRARRARGETTMEDIREKYGSSRPGFRERSYLTQHRTNA